MNNQDFTFEISLSVLDHLGRKLYRSFVTVLGEAISNAWDADAKNVWIYVNRDNAALLIKDDGTGMTAEQFQNRFLKVGYSKRKDGIHTSPSGRPLIGRKGIGKLALLSSAEKITILSKALGDDYVKGIISNKGLDDAIKHDLRPDEYTLGSVVNMQAFSEYTKGHNQGTIIHFENMKEGIHNTLEHIKKILALYFRFSLIDDTFNIYVNNEIIDNSCLADFANKTQFLWTINELNDPYVNELLESFNEQDNEHKKISTDIKISGFIASTKHYKDVNIRGTDEKVSVDLFVNGRLREKDILKHISFSRVVENYLYGQVHFDDLDDDEDRFTSSREGVVANDSKFAALLKDVREYVLRVIVNDWDPWRRKHRDSGDPDNKEITRKQRISEELYNTIANEYSKDIKKTSREKGRLVDEWTNELQSDAVFNFESYGECFVAENLIRRYLTKQSIPLKEEVEQKMQTNRKREMDSKIAGNVNIDIRKINRDLNYLDMAMLAKVADSTSNTNNLMRDAKEYKPMRDAIMHTAQLTDLAKQKLTTVFNNIKARVKSLLSDKK